MKFSILSLLFLNLLFSTFLFSQPTGDFVVSFPSTDPLLAGDTVQIHFHVPPTYDSLSPFKLILGLHGLGDPDNSEQIRDYLSPVGDSIDAIVMCPAPYLGDQPRSESVINTAIDSAQTWFNLDTDEMYIAGYSAGSDVAAQYALASPQYPMKGLIWYAPGFFTSPNMSNAAGFPPVCLCWGDQDFVSIFQANALNNTFTGSAVPYYYNVIPNVGHTMNFPQLPAEILECINFIDGAVATGSIDIQGTVTRLDYFPNPVSDRLHLKINLKAPAPLRVKILAVQGGEVWQGMVPATALLHEMSLDLDGFPNGMYILRIDDGQSAFSGKFLIHR